MMSPFGRNKPQCGASLSSSPPQLKADTGYHWPRMHKKHHTAVPSCSSSSIARPEPHHSKNMAKIALLNPSETVVFETKTRNGTAVVVFNACVPINVHPGEEFYVANSPIVSTTTGAAACSCSTSCSTSSSSHSAMVRVTCPRNCIPGQRVAIIVPKEAAHKMEASVSSSVKGDFSRSQSQNKHQQQQQSIIQTAALKVANQSRQPVPTVIQVHHERDGGSSDDDDNRDDDCEHEIANFKRSFDHHDETTRATARITDNVQHFQVTVPPSAVPGQTLTVLAGGKRVRVTCPKDAVPGSTIRF